MPATNWPSDASFSDCASRSRSAACSCFQPGLVRDVAGDEHVTGGLAAGADQRRHRRPANVPPSRGSSNRRVRPRSLAASGDVRRRRPRGQLRADQRFERRDPSARPATAPSRSTNASFICTTRSPLSVTTTRSTSELKVSSSSRRCRRISSSSWMFSIAADSCRLSSRAKSAQLVLARDRRVSGPSTTSAPSARRQPRSGASSTGPLGVLQELRQLQPHAARRRRIRIVGSTPRPAPWRGSASEEAARISRRARRWCSQTEVRVAPSRTLASTASVWSAVSRLSAGRDVPRERDGQVAAAAGGRRRPSGAVEVPNWAEAASTPSARSRRARPCGSDIRWRAHSKMLKAKGKRTAGRMPAASGV